jgi:hypothetical protein
VGVGGEVGEARPVVVVVAVWEADFEEEGEAEVVGVEVSERESRAMVAVLQGEEEGVAQAVPVAEGVREMPGVAVMHAEVESVAVALREGQEALGDCVEEGVLVHVGHLLADFVLLAVSLAPALRVVVGVVQALTVREPSRRAVVVGVGRGLPLKEGEAEAVGVRVEVAVSQGLEVVVLEALGRPEALGEGVPLPERSAEDEKEALGVSVDEEEGLLDTVFVGLALEVPESVLEDVWLPVFVGSEERDFVDAPERVRVLQEVEVFEATGEEE